MLTELLIRYTHIIAVFGIVATVFSENLLVKKEMTKGEVLRLSKIDSFYGFTAIVAVAMGLLMWFAVGKPAEFYTNNWIFHLKVGLAIAMALMSLPPTLFFMRNRKGDLNEILTVPNSIRNWIRVELVLLFIIPLCAVLMARGIGYMM